MRLKIIKFSFLILAILAFFLLILKISNIFSTTIYFRTSSKTLFPIQSVDTMKYSRDMARQFLEGKKGTSTIDSYMKLVADTGATHVAIGTPYDKEFIPVLKMWVNSAREHGLSVWFRGNFSGWEGWFDYKKIDIAKHKNLLTDFLWNNASIFKDGDIFTPCPECENGGEGDPRNTGKTDEYLSMLVDEYVIAKNAVNLKKLDVKVYASMNADIARYVMDKKTVKSLGGTILIDHYVKTVSQFISDIKDIGNKLNATIGVGEFGAPVLDLQGDLSDSDQAKYVGDQLKGLYELGDVPLVNYWVLGGGSTAIISDSGKTKLAYNILENYYKSKKYKGIITDEAGYAISDVKISVSSSSVYTMSDDSGYFELFVPNNFTSLVLSKNGFSTSTITIKNFNPNNITMKKEGGLIMYKIERFINNIISKIFIIRRL